MTGPTYPGDTSKPATGPRWKDFEDKERWKLALGVWWRITVIMHRPMDRPHGPFRRPRARLQLDGRVTAPTQTRRSSVVQLGAM